MLRISQSQFTMLSRLLLAELVEEGCSCLRDCHPERWNGASAAELREWVVQTMDRGKHLGIFEEESLLRYLEVASQYGHDFADRNDTLCILMDATMLDEWEYVLDVFDAQCHVNERGRHVELGAAQPPDVR